MGNEWYLIALLVGIIIGLIVGVGLTRPNIHT